MDDNVRKILQLLQDGKITAQEAESLISALNSQPAAQPTSENADNAPIEVGSFKLPTGDLLLQIADDPSIPENEKLTLIIHATALICTIVALQPIPGVDVLILTPIQVASVMAMSHVMGIPIGKNGAGEIVASVVGVVGGGFLAEQFVLAGAKILLPVFGGLSLIPLIYAASYGLSFAARAVLEARRSNQQLSDSEIRRIKEEAERRAKAEKRDWSLAALKSELDSWRRKAETFKQFETDYSALQQRLAPMREETDRLSLQIADLARQKMDLEDRLQALTEEMNTVPAAERAALAQQADQLQTQLAESDAAWTAQGRELDRKNREMEAVTQKLQALVRDRFSAYYPSVHLDPQALSELVSASYPRLHAAERQISWLQFEPTKANYLDETFYDGAGNLIRVIEFDQDGRLYVAAHGSEFTLRRVGDRRTEEKDIARLKETSA